jgi:malate dehydrogenase
MFFAAAASRASTSLARAFSSSASANAKVAVLGGAGGIGQPLAMLMKMSPLVSELSVYDIVNAPGVACDLSHICTPAVCKGYNADELDAALDGCDVVVIPAGVPRKPGMTRDDLFNTNASIVQTLISSVAKNCPEAMICIISNPVNSTVPIAAETLKAAGVYNPKKLFGVTTLDVVRAKTFIAERKGVDVEDIDIPVIGGHAGKSILPLLSQVEPEIEFTQQEKEELTVRIQDGGTEVVLAKDGAGSATLSMAMAGAEFAEGCIEAINGEDVVMCAYVESDVTSVGYFSTPLKIGPNGVEENFGIPELDDFEKERLEEAIAELGPSIEKGVAFCK